VRQIGGRDDVSFMRSYPNLLPLSAAAVRRIAERVMPLKFERIFGAWFDRAIRQDAKAALQRSAERYLQAMREDPA
jgi:hypothetical protein